MAGRAVFRRSIAASYEEIDALCREAREFLRDRGWGEKLFWVELLLREALTNAVRHGCCGDSAKRVEASLIVKDGLTIAVCDEGGGFDWRERLSRPEAAAEDASGRGLALMRRLAAQTRFNERGNAVVLTIDKERTAMTEVRRENGEIVVKPGRSIVASMVEEFRRELKELAEERPTALRIDLHGVDMIDSLGLGLLISAHNTLNGRGGQLILESVSEDIMSLFRIMRIDQRICARPAKGVGEATS